MDADKLKRAAELRAEADQLEEDAFNTRPLPDQWRVGQTVRYLSDQEWAWRAGAVAKIIEIDPDHKGRPASEYCVFWTSSDGGKTHRYWTTSSDVELVEDCV